jgi:[acyl-carrier-protein] S-malonyltransferase
MGKDLYDAFYSAKEVFHEVDDALSFGLSNLIFNGTEEELKATKNAQPALLAAAMAFVRVLEKEFGICAAEIAAFLAGHSLGEYTALCADGVISLSDAAKILRTRGSAMARAFPVGGAMAAVIGLEPKIVERIASECSSEKEKARVANDNSAEQTVISGHEGAVKKAADEALAFGAKRAIFLEVSGPFHCDLMQSAAVEMAEVLRDTKFRRPIKPVISNVTAKAEAGDFKRLLVRQITERVRWRESILFAAASSVSVCVEIGPGRVLTGLVKRISPHLQTINVNSVESLEEFARLRNKG